MADNSVFGLGLCAGALGLEIGLEIAIPRYRTVCMVEREISVCGRVAARVREGSIPELAIWDDVGTFDGRPWRGIVRIVSAGFPCQPFSVAGKRKGTGDERWIWPEIARIIGEVQPEIVFLENVPGLLLDPDSDFDRWEELEGQPDDALGGMGTVLRDLAGLRFNAEWCCVRASDVGASHGRKRVFILAYRRGAVGRWAEQSLSASWNGSGRQGGAAIDSGSGAMADSRRAGIGRTSEQAGLDREWSSGDDSGANGAVADSSSSGPSIRREDERECGGSSVTENANRELGDSERGRFGIVREPSGSVGQSYGADSELAYAERDGRRDIQRDSGQGAPGNNQRLDDSIDALEHSECDTRRSSDGRLVDATWSGGSFPGDFAPGPAYIGWADVLLRRPWLRPSWSQAEAESYFRNLVDGLAPLVAAERTGALRTLGNGVVPLQAALGFTILARRAGLSILCQEYFSNGKLSET